jgi:hypothetical protein
MRAITLWQPWASLVAIGAKPYEFRSWRPPSWVIGERVGIHAAARPVQRIEIVDLVRRLETGDPKRNPCLHPELALPFLRRVLAGLPDRRKAKGIRDDIDVAWLDAEPYACPTSAVLCTAILGPPRRGDLCAAEFGRVNSLHVPAIAGSAFNWGWPLRQIRPLVPPESARGLQGFWTWKIDESAPAVPAA